MAVGWKGTVPLDGSHVLAGFTSGKGALDEWLARRAAASQEVSRAARTYVVEPDNCVVGYFSLATVSLAYADLTGRAKRNMANPVPAVLLTRFATDLSCQGQGLGQAMLRSAAEAVKRAADTVGVACFLVHAKDEESQELLPSLRLRGVAHRRSASDPAAQGHPCPPRSPADGARAGSHWTSAASPWRPQRFIPDHSQPHRETTVPAGHACDEVRLARADPLVMRCRV